MSICTYAKSAEVLVGADNTEDNKGSQDDKEEKGLGVESLIQFDNGNGLVEHGAEVLLLLKTIINHFSTWKIETTQIINIRYLGSTG